MPAPRHAVGAAVVDGKLFVVGGRGDAYQPLSSIAIFDPATEQWHEGPPMGEVRFGTAVATL
eukprot:6793181-Prymnesium_polylepis.1